MYIINIKIDLLLKKKILISTMIRYTHDEIDIIRNRNIQIDVSDDILERINSIVTQVGSPTYIRTPMFTKKKRNKSYESMVIPNKPEKTFGQKILEILNKLNNSTYDVMKPKLIEIINSSKSNNNNHSEIVSKIYELVSFQSFNIELYGVLFKDLVILFPELKELCLQEFNNYIPHFINIKCTGSDNYDLFCEYNEKNDSIRCLSRFYVELYKHKLLDLQSITNLIENIQNNLLEKIKVTDNDPNESPCVEYTENIYTLIIGTSKELINSSQWNNIYNILIEVKALDRKIYKNMNSKIKFKHMDILDFIKKI